MQAVGLGATGIFWPTTSKKTSPIEHRVDVKAHAKGKTLLPSLTELRFLKLAFLNTFRLHMRNVILYIVFEGSKFIGMHPWWSLMVNISL